MRLDLTRRILLNTVSSGLGQFARLGQALLLTPYLLAKLGPQRFAVWSLALVFSSYFVIFDLGMGAALIKRVAAHAAADEMAAMRIVVNTGIAIHLAATAVLSLIFFVARHRILELLHVPPELAIEAQSVFAGLLMVVALAQISVSFQAILIGLQRMDLTNAVQIGLVLLRLIGSFVVVEAGYGARGLVLVEVGVLLLGTSMLGAMAWRLLLVDALGFRYVRWRALRELLRYGLRVQTSQAVGLAGLKAPQLILGLCVSLEAVAFYEVGKKLVEGVKSLTLVIASTVVPVASALDATEGVPALQRFYLRAMKYIFLVSVPLTGLGLVTAPSLICVWVGQAYTPAVTALQVLGVGSFVHVLTAMGTKICRGMGRPELETEYVIILFVLSVGLNVLAARTWGYMGVLIATLIALVVSSAYFLVRFHRLIRLPSRRLLSEVCTIPLGSGCLAGLWAWGISLAARRILPMAGRASELGLLAAQSLLFTSVYAACIKRGRYLDAADLQLGLWIRRGFRLER